MPNIFNGLDEMCYKQYKFLIASLEEISLGNAMNEVKQKANNRIIKVYNGFRKVIKKNMVEEPEIVSMKERILNKNKELEAYNYVELKKRIRKILLEKLASEKPPIDADPTRDEVSVRVIDMAARFYHLRDAEYMLPAEKAEDIYYIFYKKLREYCIKAEKKATDSDLESEYENIKKTLSTKVLQNVNKEEQKVIEQILDTENFDQLKRKYWVVDIKRRWDCFMDLTEDIIMPAVIMHVILKATEKNCMSLTEDILDSGTEFFTLKCKGYLLSAGASRVIMLKNKRNLKNALMAYLVWGAMMFYGKRVTVREEELPSWFTEEKKKEVVGALKEISKLEGVLEETKNEHDSIVNEVNSCDNIIWRIENSIEQLEKAIECAKQDIIDASAQTDGLRMEIESAQRRLESVKEDYEIAKGQYNVAEANLECERENARIHNPTDPCDAEEPYDTYYYDDDFQRAMREFEAEKDNYEQALNLYRDANDSLKEAKRELSDNLSFISQRKEDIIGYTNKIEINEEKLEETKQNRNHYNKQSEVSAAKVTKQKKQLEAVIDRERNTLIKRWDKFYHKFVIVDSVCIFMIKEIPFYEWHYIERVLMELHEVKDPVALRSDKYQTRKENDFYVEFKMGCNRAKIYYEVISNEKNGKTVKITGISF